MDSLEAQGVWIRDKVDEPPALLSMPQVAYPDVPGMRTSGGRIILQGIVDQAGNIEPASIRVIAAFEPRLTGFAADAFRKSRFKPAQVHGQPVRVLVNLPIDFAPKGPRERQP
jgi:periplasmic protein TonB